MFQGEHCRLDREGLDLYMTPLPGARTCVNGAEITERTMLGRRQYKDLTSKICICIPNMNSRRKKNNLRWTYIHLTRCTAKKYGTDSLVQFYQFIYIESLKVRTKGGKFQCGFLSVRKDRRKVKKGRSENTIFPQVEVPCFLNESREKESSLRQKYPVF